MNEWIELREGFFENRPIGSDIEPTEYYLVTDHCRLTPGGRLRKKLCVETLTGKNRADLDKQLSRFIKRPDVRYTPPTAAWEQK